MGGGGRGRGRKRDGSEFNRRCSDRKKSVRSLIREDGEVHGRKHIIMSTVFHTHTQIYMYIYTCTYLRFTNPCKRITEYMLTVGMEAEKCRVRAR